MASVAAILFSAGTILGQSGRPVPKRPPASPVPAATPEPAVQQERPPKPYTLKVLADIPQAGYFAFPFPERSKTWTVEQLKRSPLLEVRDLGMATRREAIERAENETEAFVVLLQMEADPIYLSPGSRAAAGEIYIDFWVYLPVTGKVKQTGRVRLSQTSRDGIGRSPVLRTCRPDLSRDDFLLYTASMEISDRIMSSWNIPLPKACK